MDRDAYVSNKALLLLALHRPAEALALLVPLRDGATLLERRQADGSLGMRVAALDDGGYSIVAPGHGTFRVAFDGSVICCGRLEEPSWRWQRPLCAQGLPLAANSAALHLEQLAAASTRLALVADQIAGEHGVAPLSVMLRDASDATTLCRVFRVQDQKLTLTAVSSDSRLASVALDPALAKIEMALWTPS